MRTEISVTELVYYPLKSGRGINAQSARVVRRGLQNDRRWMLVDTHGVFLTARTHPQLLRIRATPGDNGTLELSDDSGRRIKAELTGRTETMNVEIWGCQTSGLTFDSSIDEWLSNLTGIGCRLVYMSTDVVRPIKSSPGDEVSYADGYPLLLTNGESLAHLNEKLSTPVSMGAFRPNVVIEDAKAFAELGWNTLRIGAVEFKSGGACVRCAMTVLDPQTGQRRTDGEPLKTLSDYQRTSSGVVFGVNLIPVNRGTIRVGDPVKILD
ncbi:MAG: MOSC N-terminal beta barrel domain-containing protein [Myxococcota bacterium]|nr:MOSC N-terminal beta barrel domain-containing protein [Myxococcota bacterium]